MKNPRQTKLTGGSKSCSGFNGHANHTLETADPAISFTPIPDTDAAVAFLKTLRPGGPWAISTLHPDGGQMTTLTFLPETVHGLRDFIDASNGVKNLYYAVNTTPPGLGKKAEKTQISRVDHLHVDVDARAGEPLEEEIERIRCLAPDGVPPPTYTVMTGGGFQFIWSLDKPIVINGDLSAAEDAERFNIQLEIKYGGDHCHNVDRILRLPGTVNLPNEKKRGRGRVPVLAELTAHHPDRVYTIDKFKRVAAPSKDAPRKVIAAPTSVADVSELDTWGVPDRLKVIMAQGIHPDEPPKPKDNSRSAWLMDFCCNMVRCGVPDAVLLGIITDPSWPISESVTNERYARRQIKKAHEFVDRSKSSVGTLDQQIDRINRRYFAALNGGKIAYWREDDDHLLTPMNKTAFLFETALIRHRIVEGGRDGKRTETIKPTAPVWMIHDRRRYFDKGFILDSAAEHDGPAYNLWRGFAVEPAEGDWSLMQAHVLDVLASGDEAHARYITRWTAWTLQNPATPPRVALVFRGGQGVGKGVFLRAVVDVFGVHGMRIQSMKHLVGNFNAHLRSLCFLFADEAVVPGTDSEGTLNGLITEPTIPIEAKGIDVVNAENHLSVAMASNKEYVVRAAADARRIAMFDAADHRAGDHGYFRAMIEQMESGGLAAMLHDMLALDLSGFHPEADRPDTAAVRDQKIRSMAPAFRAVDNMLRQGEPPCPFLADADAGTVFVATKLMIQAERLDADQVTALGRALGAVAGAGAKSVRATVFTGRYSDQHRGKWLPPLELARQNWGRFLGYKIDDWPADVETWAVEAVAARGDDDEIPF